MKLTINKLYGYKVCHKRKARYTNSYYLALFEKHQLEKETNKKWKVIPTTKKECKRVSYIYMTGSLWSTAIIDATL